MRIAAAASRRHHDERSADLRNHQSADTKGITDSVSVTEAALIRLLARFMTRQPGDSIIERVPRAFRRCLRQLVDGLSLNNLLLEPYSVRRGSATSLFRATNSLDDVVLKGCWAN